MTAGKGQSQSKDIESSPTDFEQLMHFCEQGMLYEAEAWLEAGRVATQPEDSKHCPLTLATEMGFHSLVKLLLGHACTDEQKLNALEQAAEAGNLEICKLLVEAGTTATHLRFWHLDHIINRPLIEYLLDHGLDLARDNDLAHLLVNRRVKPLLGIYLQHIERFPEWKKQAAIALCEFVRSRDKKWTSLMIWAGADPLLPVHELTEDLFEPEDDDWKETALELAARTDDPSLFKMLKITPSTEQATDLLFKVWYRPDRAMVRVLLDAGANVNSYLPDEGSLLHLALHTFARGPTWSRQPHPPEQDVELISWLIRKGAKWRLPESAGELNSLRRQLYDQSGEHVVEAIRLLHAGNTCNLKQLVELVDKPKMRGWVKEYDPKLFRDLGF